MYDSERRSRSYYEGRARWYDWSNRIAALLRGTSDSGERGKAICRLNLKHNHRVLEVCAGTGSNLALMAKQIGPEGRLFGLDISPSMLSRCRRKLRHRKVEADLVQGEAAHLPFADDAFDAVLHHGGIAEFGDKRGAIDEMMRVAKPDAKVVICDAGVSTDRKLSLTNRLLLKFQPVYEQPPPVELVPSRAKDLHLTWFHGGGWYMIEFVNP